MISYTKKTSHPAQKPRCADSESPLVTSSLTVIVIAHLKQSQDVNSHTHQRAQSTTFGRACLDSEGM